MGLFLRQQESRSKLQSRINKELQDKLKQTANIDPTEVEPQFLDDNHQATRSGMFFIALAGLVILAVIVWLLIK